MRCLHKDPGGLKTSDPGTGWKYISDPGGTAGKVLNSDPGGGW